jgi:hypothetical protein
MAYYIRINKSERQYIGVTHTYFELFSKDFTANGLPTSGLTNLNHNWPTAHGIQGGRGAI